MYTDTQNAGAPRVGRPAADLLGRRFGRLVVAERRPNNKRIDRPTWLCACDCGKEITLHTAALTSGRNKSCGCLRRDRAGGLYRKHGRSKTPQYTMYYDARKRAIRWALPFDIEPEDIVIPDRCPVLGIQLDADPKSNRDNRPSLDRKVPAKGYVKGNVCVISFRANRIKSDATPEELRLVLAYCGGDQ